MDPLQQPAEIASIVGAAVAVALFIVGGVPRLLQWRRRPGLPYQYLREKRKPWPQRAALSIRDCVTRRLNPKPHPKAWLLEMHGRPRPWWKKMLPWQ
jgi:hypothetical protein